MVRAKFSYEDTVKFIRLYKEQECLWRTDLVTYRDKISKWAALEHIRLHMNMEDFTAEDVKVKIKHLRCTYMLQLTKMKDASRMGMPCYPSLRWFNEMDSFINGTKKYEIVLQPETASSPTEDSQSRDDACCSSTSLRDSEERASGNSICCWQPEHYFLFISLYKEQERLWNPHNPAYREVGARASALERLAQGMGFSDFTITDVEKKIRYIRGTYMNELNRIEESLCSGSDTIYKPVVPWFDALDSFLRNVHTGANNSHDTLQNEIKVEFSCEDNDEDVEQDFVHLHPEPTSWAAAERAERLAESAAKRARDGAGEGDEFAVFARHVATQLRALPLAFALEAQETIQSALTRYRLKTIRK